MTYLIHCHALGNIMSDAKSIGPSLLDSDLLALSKKKSKTDADQAILQPFWDRTLSAGAKTYLKSIAKQIVYGYRSEVNTKFMEKGIRCEQDSIDLYNYVFLTDYAKNTERRTNQWLTGECDIDRGTGGTDIKTAWSLETFPALVEDAHDSAYEWQGRAYMMLWPEWQDYEVAFALVDTPDDLIRYEPEHLHKVSHIDPRMRLTIATYERDLALEEKIKAKCEAAQEYIEKIVAQIKREHSM